jgi:WD40 repeat protein
MVWTIRGEPLIGFKSNCKNLTSLAFSPDTQILATGGLGDDIQLWSLPGGELVGTLQGHQTAVFFLRFIQNGKYLVSLGYEGTIRFWDTANWSEEKRIKPDVPQIRGLVFSPNEKSIAIGMESRVQVRSLENWILQDDLEVGTKAVNGMAFSPDGEWFAVGAADRKIRVWRML